MSARFSSAVLAFSFAITLAPAALAAPFDPDRVGPAPLPMPRGEPLVDGRITLPPKAFVTFCATYDDQCVRRGDRDEITLDADAWATLREVNRRVNRGITVKSDPPGTDIWLLNVSAGDCDEFALEKRRELIERGWPTAALSLAAAYVSSGQAHLVLTVRTDHGDLVLDNLRDSVIAADRTGYRWIARQSALHPRLWVSVINTGNNVPVARLRAADSDAAPIATGIGRATAADAGQGIGRDIGRSSKARPASRDIGIGLGG